MISNRTYGIDPDVIAYNARIVTAGNQSLNFQAIRDLNQFVISLKKINLWGSTVLWPLRSSQNAGNGTVAYSLGGRGLFNGTLSNGPIWGTDGILFDGVNDRIILANNSFGVGNSPISILVFLKNNNTAVRQIVLSQGNNNSTTDAFSLESPSSSLNEQGSMAFTSSPSLGTPNTSWKSLFQGNTTVGFVGKNGGTISQYSLNNTLNKSGLDCSLGAFGNPAGVAPLNGVIAGVVAISITPTTSLNSYIHNLYRSTLGQGLNLP